MMMLDERGHIEGVNPAASRLFGYPAPSMIGQSNLMLFKDPPSNEVSQAYLQRLAAGTMEDNRQLFEGARGDGTVVEAEVVTTPIRLADGLHFLAIARDATERRQIERMKDEFVATVSHELRTPLTSVAGSLGLILGGAAGDISDKSKRLVQIAYNNCNRLIRLINDMLDIEKIESGKTTLNLQPVSLAPAIESSVTALASFAAEHGVSAQVNAIPAECHLVADPDRLAQIITNLLSNAIKFSPAGGTVEVEVSGCENGRTRITVSDDGPGIASEFHSRIFQKFAQADATDSRQKGGTGLGLSIVKELAERMGGQVGFESVEGAGSRFYVDLPSLDPTPSVAAAAEQLGRMDEDAAPQILHVDDDPDTLRLVASAFEDHAIVHSSPSLEEARATIERYDFDAVILDIAMPDGNGLELIELIQSQRSGSLPVILYTALDEDREEDVEVYARLTKSKASLAELVRTFEQALRKGSRKTDD
jgi:PAS domain S-box-containing protein